MQKIQLDGTHYFLRFLSLQRIFATDETIKVWCLNVIFDIIEILNGNIWQISPSALSELFEKVDVSGDGTISIEEYVSMCETYGIKVTRALHLLLSSPSGNLGISLVSGNHPTHPSIRPYKIVVWVLESFSNWTKQTIMGSHISSDVPRMFSDVLKMLLVARKMFSYVRPLTLFICSPHVRWFYDDFQRLQWFAMILTARPWKRDQQSDITRFKDCCYNDFCEVGKNHWVWWFSNGFWVSHIPSLQSTISISPKLTFASSTTRTKREFVRLLMPKERL